jgi:hypothetical protein
VDRPGNSTSWAHREELGVAVDAGEALPHHAALPQVPLVRDQQVQRPVLVLRQRACRAWCSGSPSAQMPALLLTADCSMAGTGQSLSAVVTVRTACPQSSTKVIVAEEHRQLHGLQRSVQLCQPVVRQLAGAQEVLHVYQAALLMSMPTLHSTSTATSTAI